MVQLRSKHATDRQRLAWAAAIRAVTRRFGVVFVMNDRFDLALAAGADGVHLGQQDLPPGAIPGPLRAGLRVGRSTHTLEQVRQAREEGVDYVAFGPVFGTTSKQSELDPRGVDRTAEAVRLAHPLPLVAIGGIDASHVPALRAAGVAGIAVISAVSRAADPARATAELAALLGGAR